MTARTGGIGLFHLMTADATLLAVFPVHGLGEADLLAIFRAPEGVAFTAIADVGMMTHPAGILGHFMGLMVERDEIHSAFSCWVETRFACVDQYKIGLLTIHSRHIGDHLDLLLLFQGMAALALNGAGILLLLRPVQMTAHT